MGDQSVNHGIMYSLLIKLNLQFSSELENTPVIILQSSACCM